MAPPVLRPENALKRADELISVGEPQAALQSLYEYLSSRRIRFAQPTALEPIVFKFLELGVDLKKGKIIKDGLHQYKKNVQITSEGLVSVGVVSRKFIDLIEAKMAREQAKADQEEQGDADEDLEGGVTPENLLISAFEQDQSVGGFNDEAVTSWLRFTWESYRAVLDLLRNNSQLEITYSGVVNRTMLFCLKYNRKNEFKRLADMLRQHLDAANYQQSKAGYYTVDLSDADTLQRYLDQRFQQVNVSVKLELWHEAFRSIEDVHHLMSMSKRQPRPSILANYYENLAKVFFVSGNYLLNAAAWEKFYKLYLKNPNATEKDFKFYASTFMLASLAVQPDDLPVVGYDPLIRLCNLLNLDSKPTRRELIEVALTEEVFSKVDDEIKQLHDLLSSGFDITTIKEKLTQLLPALEAKPYFKSYVTPLKNYIIRRIFVSASQLYETIKSEELRELATLPAPFDLSSLEIEKALMQAAMEDYVTFTIDHESGTITFTKDPFDALAAATATSVEESLEDEDEQEDGETHNEEETGEPEPVVTRNAAIRAQLAELAKALKETEGFAQGSYMNKVKIAREHLIQKTNETISRERKAAEERTRQLEEEKLRANGGLMSSEQIAEDRQRRMMEEKAAADARMEAEAKRRAEEKFERERAAVLEGEMKKLIEEVNAKGIIYIDPKEAKNMDAETIRKMTIEQLSKDKKDLDERMRVAFKRLDHTERAFRKVELPLLEKDADLQEERDLENYNDLKQRLVGAGKKEHEQELKLHERLIKISSDYKAFKAKILATKEAKLTEARAKNLAKFEAAKKARIDEIRQQRYEELVARRQEELKQQQEFEREAREEEEKSRAESEKAARLAKERDERARVNKEKDELARRQREMEEEIERKLATKNSVSQAAAPAPVAEKTMSFAERMKLRRQGGGAPAPAPAPVAAPAPAPVAAPAPAPAPAPTGERKLTFAERMRLKREGKI